MSDDERISRWGNRVLNLALCALGIALMALVYALVSQHLWQMPSTPSASPAAARAGAPGKATPEEGGRREIVQVGVRNGCGVSGLAAEARAHLVRAGFDVVEVGNYTSFDVDSSVVIDRVGNRAAARRVAQAMGLPEARVRQEISTSYYLDATVVIGADYRTLDFFDAGEHSSAATHTGTQVAIR